MKKLATIAVYAVLSILLLTGTSNATLLGLDLGLPDVNSDTTGTAHYNAATDLFTSTATPLTVTFDGVNLITIENATSHAKSYSVGFHVDGSGNFSGGISGNDLEIWGKFTYNSNTYDGLLIAGEVTAFGWQKLSSTKYTWADFAFDLDPSSLLYSYFADTSYIGGDATTVENDGGWVGTWASNFDFAKVKHDTAPVPEPATMLLVGSGLFGLAGLGKRKLFKRG